MKTLQNLALLAALGLFVGCGQKGPGGPTGPAGPYSQASLPSALLGSWRQAGGETLSLSSDARFEYGLSRIHGTANVIGSTLELDDEHGTVSTYTWERVGDQLTLTDGAGTRIGPWVPVSR